jgi:hypothetical protein
LVLAERHSSPPPAAYPRTILVKLPQPTSRRLMQDSPRAPQRHRARRPSVRNLWVVVDIRVMSRKRMLERFPGNRFEHFVQPANCMIYLDHPRKLQWFCVPQRSARVMAHRFNDLGPAAFPEGTGSSSMPSRPLPDNLWHTACLRYSDGMSGLPMKGDPIVP